MRKIIIGDTPGEGVSPVAPVRSPERVGVGAYRPGVEIWVAIPPRIDSLPAELRARRGEQMDFLTRDEGVGIVHFSHFTRIGTQHPSGHGDASPRGIDGGVEV